MEQGGRRLLNLFNCTQCEFPCGGREQE